MLIDINIYFFYLFHSTILLRYLIAQSKKKLLQKYRKNLLSTLSPRFFYIIAKKETWQVPVMPSHFYLNPFKHSQNASQNLAILRRLLIYWWGKFSKNQAFFLSRQIRCFSDSFRFCRIFFSDCPKFPIFLQKRMVDFFWTIFLLKQTLGIQKKQVNVHTSIHSPTWYALRISFPIRW